MKRPEGFDEGTARPTAPDEDASAPARPARTRPSIGDRLRRAGSPSSTRPDDGLEAPSADLFAPPDRDGARSARALPDLPDVDEDSSSAGAQRTTPISDAAGTAGRRIGQGFTAVASRLRELSPDEEFVDPHAPARRVRPEADVRAAETAHDARLAKRRRRLLERTEIRRFTRRARHRRAAWITAGSVVAVLVLSVVIAVYSPLMALRTIKVEGTSRVDAAQVQNALDTQLGTPLARVDFGRIKQQLAGFPLIASFVTEEQPPHTLVVTITERQAIVAVKTASGYELVDPAGIVVEAAKAKPAGMPEVDIDAARIGDPVFRTMTDVVLSLPTPVRATVSTVTASTADDVTLTLSSGSKVVWGNASDSTAKATLLAALIKDHDKRDPATKVEYDVSAPDNGIIRSQS